MSCAGNCRYAGFTSRGTLRATPLQKHTSQQHGRKRAQEHRQKRNSNIDLSARPAALQTPPHSGCSFWPQNGGAPYAVVTHTLHEPCAEIQQCTLGISDGLCAPSKSTAWQFSREAGSPGLDSTAFAVRREEQIIRRCARSSQ